MEEIFGKNYENNLIRKEIIKMRKDIKLKKEHYKNYLIKNYNIYKVKPKNIDSLIKNIKLHLIKKRNFNSTITLYPSVTERVNKINKLKKELLKISSFDNSIKNKRIFNNSKLYYSPNKSLNNISTMKINNFTNFSLENKEKNKLGFFKRIRFTDKFKQIIKEKERLNNSENNNIKIKTNFKNNEKTNIRNFKFKNINKLNKHFENELQSILKNSIYKESELFNKRLNNIKKIKVKENMSVYQYQRNLMKIIPDEYAKDSIDKLTTKMGKINKESNSVKARENKKFIFKIVQKEKKILDDINKKMTNLKKY